MCTEKAIIRFAIGSWRTNVHEAIGTADHEEERQIVQMPWTGLMLRVHWGARSIVLQELEVATMGHRMAQVSHSNHHC